MGMMENLREKACSAWTGAPLAAMALALACVFASLAAMGTTPQQALALDQDATLTLVAQYEEEDGSITNIDGMELTAYQVAKVAANGAYEPVAPFDTVEADFNGQMTASQMLEAASKMADVASQNDVKGTKAVADSDGNAKFGVLDPGIYLVMQTGADDTALDFYELAPFVINVPQFNVKQTAEDGTETEGTVFNVTAIAKPEPREFEYTTTTESTHYSPHETTSSTEKSKSTSSTKHKSKSKSSSVTPRRTPQTGDAVTMEIIALCALLGFTSMGIAIVAARRRRE